MQFKCYYLLTNIQFINLINTIKFKILCALNTKINLIIYIKIINLSTGYEPVSFI